MKWFFIFFYIYHYYLTGNIVDLITLCEHIYHTHTQIHTKAHTHEYFTISSLKTDVKKKKETANFCTVNCFLKTEDESTFYELYLYFRFCKCNLALNKIYEKL